MRKPPREVRIGQHFRSELGQELPSRIARLKKLRLRVPEIAIETAVLLKQEGVVAMTECFRQSGDCLIGVTVFDRARDRLFHHVGRAKFMLQIVFDADAAENGDPAGTGPKAVFRMNR